MKFIRNIKEIHGIVKISILKYRLAVLRDLE